MTTYTKLRSGAWGLRGEGLVEGHTVLVSTRDGARKIETVGRVLWRGDDGMAIATIAGPPRSWICRTCGEWNYVYERECWECGSGIILSDSY